MAQKIVRIQGITDRIVVAKFGLKNGGSMTIIQIYAPTAEAEETKNEEFYEDLRKSGGKGKP